MSITRVTVEVLGEQYSIKCNDNAKAKLTMAAKELTAICDKVQQSNTPIARDRVLVVAALNLASQVLDSNRQQELYSERVQLLSDKVDIIE